MVAGAGGVRGVWLFSAGIITAVISLRGRGRPGEAAFWGESIKAAPEEFVERKIRGLWVRIGKKGGDAAKSAVVGGWRRGEEVGLAGGSGNLKLWHRRC
jgi:hypothetical protein